MYGIPEARIFVTDRWLDDGDKVTLGETEFEVFHCPGHTPGHVVFFHRETKFAQVGDVLFQGSIGRTDFPLGNHQDLIDSITQKLWPLGDDVTFIPGHGPTSQFGYERKVNAYVSDHVGRRGAFRLFGAGFILTASIYLFAPLGNSAAVLIPAGFIYGFFQFGIYASFGPYFTELFPTEVRATGQAFAYNLGRGTARCSSLA